MVVDVAAGAVVTGAVVVADLEVAAKSDWAGAADTDADAAGAGVEAGLVELAPNNDPNGLGAVEAGAAGANTEVAAVVTPFGTGETDLDGFWPKMLLEAPRLGDGGLPVADGVGAPKSEDPGRLISDGTEVCAGFWPKMFEGAGGCSLTLRLPSGEVLMSSASLVTLKRGFWIVVVVCPKLKVLDALTEGAFPNKEGLALFGVDGAARDCPNKDAAGLEAVAV